MLLIFWATYRTSMHIYLLLALVSRYWDFTWRD